MAETEIHKTVEADVFFPDNDPNMGAIPSIGKKVDKSPLLCATSYHDEFPFKGPKSPIRVWTSSLAPQVV